MSAARRRTLWRTTGRSGRALGRAAFGAAGGAQPMAPALVALGLLVACLASAPPAEAQRLFPERFVACRDLDAAAETRTPPATPTGGERAPSEPLARPGPPPRLRVEPLVVIDVPMAEPIPVRPAPLRSAAPPPDKVRRRTLRANDYKCLGFPRGRGGIAEVVSSPMGTRWHAHGPGEGYRLDNITAAGAFGAREMVGALERHLRRAVPAGIEGYREWEALSVKLRAALALADLGHTPAAPLVAALVRELEGRNRSSLWADALDPLARLDRALAQRYAVEALERLRSTDRGSPGWTGRLRRLLPLVTEPDTQALERLRALSEPLERHTSDTARHDDCLILAARIRGGDRALRDEVRPELASDLRTERAVTCYSPLVAAAFPGDTTDEVEVLTHRWRYEEIVRLAGRLRARERAGERDPAVGEAKAKLRRWLAEQAAKPEIAGDRSDNRFNPVQRARQLVAELLLGDPTAQRRLAAFVADATDRGHAPWIALHHMLEHDLPGAADLAAARLRRATSELTERFDNTDRPYRGPLLVTEHVTVVDDLARRGDARFALGLLDRDGFARHAALVWLARAKPVEACEIVASAADGAERKAIEDAFWGLSVLGDACAPAMRRLATEPGHPDAVRGMAIELLAMMRDPSVPGRLREAEAGHGLRASAERAAIIYRSP